MVDMVKSHPYSYGRIGHDNTSKRLTNKTEGFYFQMDIRKTVTLIEDTLVEGGKPLPQPFRRVASIAVIRNPLIGRDDENLDQLVHEGEDLGRFLARRAIEHLDRNRVSFLGKAAIVGLDGEPEHGQAVLYPKFAAAVRETLEMSAVPVQSDKKIGQAGTMIEVRLQQIAGDGDRKVPPLDLKVPGSPRADEILVALVVGGATGSQLE